LKNIEPIPLHVKLPFTTFGIEVEADVDVTLGCPQINIKAISGRQVDVLFEMTGSVTINTTKITFPLHPDDPTVYLVATLSLTQVESTLQDKKQKNQTKYDLHMDFKSGDFIVDLKFEGVEPGTLASLTVLCKNLLIKYIGNHKDFYVASFYLEDSQSLQPWIPHLGDYSFVLNDKNPDASQLLVLMLTTSTKTGYIDFNSPIDFPADAPFFVLVNNHILLQNAIWPCLEPKILSMCKDPDKAKKKLSVSPIPGTLNPLYKIANTGGTLALNQDHDPWIQTIECYVDQNAQQLLFSLDVKCDATFMKIHIDTWDKAWFRFVYNPSDGKLKLVKANEKSGKSTSMEWWKWLLSALVGFVGVIVTSILYALTDASNPNLDGTFNDVAQTVVQWPYQKEIEVKEVQLPGNAIIFLDVHL